MKAHIVGGGFGGLAAAAYLIRHAATPGQDITIYEADRQAGGGLFLGGDAQSGYNLPGSVFDSQFRCAFELLADIPSTRDPKISVKDEFFAFNASHPFNDQTHIIDRSGQILHGPRFGLSLKDGFDLVRLSVMSEARLEGRRIDEFFSPHFFASEFWLLWSTIMGSLPQHSAAEFRRYMNRALHLFPYLSNMRQILRTPLNQYQAFIEPLVGWLRARRVNFLTGAFVADVGLASSGDRLTVTWLDLERQGAADSVSVAPDDIVLITLGSQIENMSVGSMNTAPQPNSRGRSSALWRRLAQQHDSFGKPDVFFGADQTPSSRWVSFTVTTAGPEFFEQMTKLVGGDPGTAGLVTLKDSSWLLSLTIFHQPEIIGQSSDTHICWGYGLFPEKLGDWVKKPMNACTGAEILEEVLKHLRFDRLDQIMASSNCVPCDMPYVNNIWIARRSGDRPAVVPAGATNFGFVGQYVELPKDIAFTIEYSARAAWQAVYVLLKRGPPPPPVYQSQYDPKALLAALKVFVLG